MHLYHVVAFMCKYVKLLFQQLNKLQWMFACLLVIRSVSRTGNLLLPADSTDGVRFGLQGHAQFGSDGGNCSWRELKMKPLQQSCEKEEHLHSCQLFTQAMPSAWKKKILSFRPMQSKKYLTNLFKSQEIKDSGEHFRWEKISLTECNGC